MKRLAEHFAKGADYDPDVVEQAHNDVMTKALKYLPPEVVSQLFDNPPEELKDFTNNCSCEDTGVLENKNRSVISTEVPADE